MQLQTIYHLQALPIIKNFVEQVATFYGATEKERFDLSLASEEAAMHIIENFPADRDDIFEIQTTFKEGSLILTFSNKGLPIDTNHIPNYDNSNPDNSIDGLKFFMMQKLTDKFSFKNGGNLGWQTILEKRLSQANTIVVTPPETKQQGNPPAQDEEITFGLATTEDAYEITKLAYKTYSYSYTKSIFYYPELLEEALKNQTIISHIAKNSKGEVISQAALYKDPHNPLSAESCSLMSDSRYRKSRYVLRVAQMQFDDLEAHTFGLNMFYANVVTSHPITQRLIRSFGLSPFAFKLSVHEESQVQNLDAKVNQRNTNLYCAYIFDMPKEPIKLNIPKLHQEVVTHLFEKINITVEINSQPEELDKEITKISTYKNQHDALADLKIETWGTDLAHRLKKELYDLTSEGIKTINLYVDANQTLKKDYEAILLQQGFFFCGLVARSVTEWDMLYISLNNQKFSFEPIAAATPIAKELLTHIKTEFEKTF